MAAILPFHASVTGEALSQAVACVESGGILAIPTDSFYALAVGAFQEAALERLITVKGERENSPFPLLVSDLSQIAKLTDDISIAAQKLMHAFWPGLLTVVLPARSNLSTILTGGSGTIGVRKPHDSRILDLLAHVGPLTGTSANRTRVSPAQSAEMVNVQLGSDIDLILDGGPTPGGLPSTVIQVDPKVRIIREGAISRSAIENVLGIKER